MEIMCLEELPWDDHHHRSFFIPNLELVENDIKSIISPNIVENSKPPIFNQDFVSKGNLGKITPTISRDILVEHGIVEHIHLV